jgi:transglutaminase-like putative cysteine protease
MRRRWPIEIGMFGATLVGGFAAARLASGAVPASVTTAAIGAVVVAALCRRDALAVVLGVAAVAASSVLWGAHAATHSGFLSSQGFSAARHSLQAAHVPLAGFHLPLVHTPGIVGLCALVAGLAAVAGRGLGTRYPGLSLVPAGALLLASTILLPAAGAAVGALFLGVFSFLVLGCDRKAVARTSFALAAVSLGTAALTMVWVVTGSGSGAVSPGGRVVPAVTPSALSLANDLTGIETRDANVVLFTARSPISTYWQVAALTQFVGDRWVPGQATEAVLRGQLSKGQPASPAGQHLFTARVTLAAYSGRLLPVPPSTVQATGAVSPVVTLAGVAATSALDPGTSYAATAIVPAAAPNSPAGSPLPAADTAIGPIPATVRKLALSITGGQSTPLGKSEALTDFFRSGRFHYKVNASSSSSRDALVSFLTGSRTGSCEQFAGAFAVMARVSGLAARVAIGFTPGRTSDGVIVVRGSDAHAWPQVLIGGNWVSFEPTPQLPSGELTPPGVLGPSGLGQPNPTGPGSLPHVSLPRTAIVAPTVPPTTPLSPVSAPKTQRSALWGLGLVVLLIAIVAALAAWFHRRRAPLDHLTRSWQAIDRALTRRGLTRPVSSTPMGHIGVLAEHRISEQARATLEDMATVASILQDVTYGAAELVPEDVIRASRASQHARKAILAGALSPSEDSFKVFGQTHPPALAADAKAEVTR